MSHNQFLSLTASPACAGVNCDIGDVNSHCEAGACVCNTGFSLSAGQCTYTGEVENAGASVFYSVALVIVSCLALLW
jgi:hypothetical protein